MASRVWDTEKETERRRGGRPSFQSDACQALTKVLVFRGGEGVRDMVWGDGRARRDTISSRDYFKEVCTVPVSTSTGIKPNPPL